MNHSEREYITLCKRLIEEKFHFENENGTLRQRDLEYLADSIEDKSGIKLSLSTLKRLWKRDYDQTPHPSTLEALISVLEYNDWHEFKSKEAGVPVISTDSKKKSPWILKRWMTVPIVLAIAVLFWLIAFRSSDPPIRPLIKGPVTFSGNKTVSQGVPNTIIFNYDVSNVVADSFFFQQSWNEKEKVKIDPNRHNYSNIYYYPGFHKAKLIANDSILKRFRVHITTDGWLPLVRYSREDRMPIYVKKDNAIEKGVYHVTMNDLAASSVNFDKEYTLSYYNVREFENTHSDNFSLDTRFVCDSINTIACPGIEVVVMCEAHIFFVRMMGKGCERDIGLKMGEVYHGGMDHDLSAFGRNLYQWQHLQIQVSDKHAIIYLDEKPVYTIDFKDDLGKVVGLSYSFLGSGAIDFVKLKNGENKVIYQEDFDN